MKSSHFKFRVGVDFHTYDGIYQGSRSHILGIYKKAIEIAPEIEFIFFLENTEKLKNEHLQFSATNVTLIKTKYRSGLFRLTLQLAWLQYKYKLDLLHTQYRTPLIPFGPCACTIHDVLFESHPEYFPKSFALQSKITFRLSSLTSKLLFTVSRFSQGELERRYNIPKSKIQVTYNGVDFDRFFPGSEGSLQVENLNFVPNNYILMLGRLEPRKNHVRLIEAYARLGHSAPPLVCIGQRDFGYEQAISASHRFGVSDRVHFLENIDDTLLPALIRNSLLFVFPAIAEGFGMPVAEALASGVPVVTSNTTSLPEVAGNAAILIDPYDVESIYRGISKVLCDPELAATLRVQGPIQAKNFDWQTSAKVLVDAYTEYSNK